jgi:hypothetical protein
MARNLKEIGLGAAIILLLAGLIVMGLGFGIINQETTDPSGIESFFNFLGGGFVVLLGGGVSLVMLVVLITMGFVEIAKRSGTKGILLGAGALVTVFILFLWSILQWGSNLLQPDPASEIQNNSPQQVLDMFRQEKVEAGIINGTVYAEPTFSALIDTVLSENYLVRIIDVTDSVTQGFPWFQISYNQSSGGYMWGGDLCANEIWANGLRGLCTTNEYQDISIGRHNHEDTNTRSVELIAAIYSKLPGIWRVDYMGYSSVFLIFNEQNEVLNERNEKGFWSVEIDQKEDDYILWLDLKYSGEQANEHERWKINSINSLTKSFDNDTSILDSVALSLHVYINDKWMRFLRQSRPLELELLKYMENEGPGRAKAFFQDSIVNNLGEYEYHTNDMHEIGSRFLKTNQVESALLFFEINTILNPDDSYLNDRAGAALLENGQLEESLKFYKKSVKLNPDNIEGQQMIARLEEELRQNK